MDIEQLLYQYNPWWEDGYKPENVIERKAVMKSLYPLLKTRDIIMLTGLRRVGKTITMKCLIQYLIEQHDISPHHCLYVSMDDYQISRLTLAEVLDNYRKVMGLLTIRVIV